MDSRAGVSQSVEQPKVVEGGLQTTIEKKFKWKLNNFKTMTQSKDALKEQKFFFDVVMDVNKHTYSSTWKVFLEPGSETIRYNTVSVIDICYRNCHPSPGLVPGFTQLQLKAFDNNGRKVDLTSKVDQNCASDPNNRKIRMDLDFSNYYSSFIRFPVQTDGSVVLNLTWRSWFTPVEVVSNDPPTTLTLYSSYRALQDKLANDFGSALEEATGIHDVKLFPSDGKEFNAHKAILAARSPVFLAMFSSDMKESKQGEVQMDDVSSAAMNFLLKYIYTGSVIPYDCGPDRSDDPEIPNIEEVLYVAEKYQLKELMAHLHEEMVQKCAPDNVELFFKLATKYSLDKVGKKIFKEVTWEDYRKLISA